MRNLPSVTSAYVFTPTFFFTLNTVHRQRKKARISRISFAMPHFLVVVLLAFSSLAKILGEVCRFICRLRFFVVVINGDRLAHTSSTFLGQDQSTMARRAETTVAECFLTSCVSWISLIDSHTVHEQHNLLTSTSWG